jgi:hypothetical protein
MIFPGRKALLENISTQNVRVDDLLNEFIKQNFSGYAEFHFAYAKGILLFHSGEIITTVYKEGDKIKSQEEGITAVKNRCRLEDGMINTYELPSEMAHMLRGLCNRKFLDEVHVSGKLQLLLDTLKESQHTGTLDLIFTERKEKGMILIINGRTSNSFLEMDKNLTLEGKDALKRIYELVNETDGTCKIFQSDFSQEIWKSRRGTAKPHESRIYEILTDKEDSAPSPLQGLLDKFAEQIQSPPFTAFLREDGTLLAKVSSEKNNGFSLEDLNKIIQDTTPLFTSVLMGEVKETLCTTQDKNLLIRTLPQQGCYHILILDRNNSPKDLRKHLAVLDKEIAELSLME